MDSGSLLALMDRFDPHRQQQEALQLQSLQQQLELQRASEERAQQQFLASQAQAQQLNPIEVQLRQAALARIPQEQAAAQLGQEQAQFGLEQSRAMAPLLQQQLGAQIAAAQAAPQHQAGMLDIQRQQLAQAAAQQAAEAKAQQEKTQLSRYGMSLEALQKGVPGVALDPSQLGAMSGGALRPAGTLGALNQFMTAGDPTGAQQYIGEHPEVQVPPEIAQILATSPAAGGGGGAAPTTPGAVDPFVQQRQLADIESASRHLSPQSMSSFPGFGGEGPLLGPALYGLDVMRNRGAQWAAQLQHMMPTQEQFTSTQEAKRRALLGQK